MAQSGRITQFITHMGVFTSRNGNFFDEGGKFWLSYVGGGMHLESMIRRVM